MTTGENITRLRKQRKWTQAQLARTVGMSRGYIAAIEQGRRRPSLKALAIIANALEVETKDIGGEDIRGGE